MTTSLHGLVWAPIVAACWCQPGAFAQTRAVGSDVQAIVELEEVVTTYVAANNGAGPLWCFGSTVIARDGEEVFLSSIETGKDVPPLCNCRWQLWHRGIDGWKLVQNEEQYRQREPCPIAALPGGSVFLSVNPSTEPAGTKYGPCRPLVLRFDRKNLAATPKTEKPAFANGTYFTDHSYRGFGADGASGELLLLNVNAKTAKYFVSHRDRQGVWHERGTIGFPIRGAYPEVALRNGAAHVLAIGDIVEPNEEWRKLKAEKTKATWDYVFRRLFYTYTPAIGAKPFTEPLEVETVDATGGHITNLDLFIDAAGRAHLLYLRLPYANAIIREKCFPKAESNAYLEYAVIKDGEVISRRTLAETPKDGKSLTPGYARFHVGSGEKLYVVAYGSMNDEAGKSFSDNFLAAPPSGNDKPVFKRLNLNHPLSNFMTNTPRGGSKPGDVIDLHGTGADPLTLRYARIRLK
jgi:hypothetical protein